MISGFGNGLADGSWNAFVGNMQDASKVLGVLHALYGLGATSAPLIATSMITKGGLGWWYFYYMMVSLIFSSSRHCIYILDPFPAANFSTSKVIHSILVVLSMDRLASASSNSSPQHSPSGPTQAPSSAQRIPKSAARTTRTTTQSLEGPCEKLSDNASRGSWLCSSSFTWVSR